MPEGKLKSRSKRRVFVRTPKGAVKVHYVPRKPGRAQCASCGEYLKGTVQVASAKLKNMSRSQKRPSRPYGGMLCSKCSRITIAQKVRSMFLLSK